MVQLSRWPGMVRKTASCSLSGLKLPRTPSERREKDYNIPYYLTSYSELDSVIFILSQSAHGTAAWMRHERYHNIPDTRHCEVDQVSTWSRDSQAPIATGMTW